MAPGRREGPVENRDSGCRDFEKSKMDKQEIKKNGSEGCPQCKGRDFRDALVILIVLLTFGIAYLKLLTGTGDETLVPPWAAGINGAALSMYFMSKGGERMREMTNEKSAKEN
jgi:hypothetical protein